jgi:hypothetical protein
MKSLSLFEEDPYRRLRPPDGGSYRDLCACTGSRPIILMYTPGSFNPIHCYYCNAEVAPEVIAFPAALAADIADWRELYEAFDVLWRRGSRAQRTWALRGLTGRGRLYRLGLAVRARLANYRFTYYWVFSHSGHELRPVTRCPGCQQRLAFDFEGKIGWWRCDECGIVADGTDEDPPLMLGE